ncbi:uncharacterized protein LOC124580844 [Schistocerca americana]|uniref:uncharacterized protein LOC124580844 n=1 Tax=Schistocerca americana TaxID=7009 RepID=UPI001F4FC6D4|nr:uncharacterized protein LOC124580844 [Schistocerca americana]
MSCTGALFTHGQVVEKSIEYIIPAHLCFIDFQNAFSRIRLTDVVKLLYNLIKAIEDIYSTNHIQAKIGSRFTSCTAVNSSIRQGDSLSLLLSDIVMDEVIKKVLAGSHYGMVGKEIKIICFADNVVLLANREDNLQKL